MGRWVLRTLVAAALALPLLAPTGALACSPMAEPPTIADLGPDQVVVVGTIGEKVALGRLFHIERWYNGRIAGTPIVIAFQEGPAVGDCSYPVQTGQHLLIAPEADPAGRLSANLVTLQADPTSEAGRRYVAEAEALFGPGEVPPPITRPSSDPGPAVDVGVAALGLGVAIVVALLFGLVIVAARRRPTTRA